MIACPACRRLRRPDGLHICLAVAKPKAGSIGLPAAPAALERSADSAPERRGRVAEPQHINRFKLPGDGPAAQVWNTLIEGKRNGLVR